MLTQIDIGHIIYGDCRFLGLPIYLKDHMTDTYEAHDDRIEESGRVVIRPKPASNDKTYFNDCVVEVNVALPDLAGERNPSLGTLYGQLLEALSDDKCGRYGGEFYRYSVQRHGIEKDEKLHCHYANITILFEILNVRR